MRQQGLSVQHVLQVLALSLVVGLHASSAVADSRSGSNTGNVSIPDAGGWVSSTITISSAPAGATVTGIDVSFKAVHPFSGDLNIDLNADAQGSLGNRDLWQREGGGADNPTRTVNGITTFNGLSVNRTWYLYARDEAAGDAGYIDEWSITVYYNAPQPGSLTLSGNAYCNTTPPVAPAVALNWTASNGATNYYVYRNGAQYAGPFSSSQRSFDNNANVTAGQSYTYFIRATNSNGSTDSNTITVNVPSNVCSGSQPPGSLTLSGNAYCNTTPPAAPAVVLNWTASNGATSYYVYRNGAQYAGPFSSSQRSFDNNANVTGGQSYTYFIRATNSNGSTDSSTITVNVPSNVCSGSQSPGSLTVSGNAYCNTTPPAAPAVVLNWTASNGATNYYVYRNGAQYAGPFSSSQRSFDNNVNVTAGQSYTYFIRATNSNGSTDSSTITVNVPSNVCSGSQPPGSLTLSGNAYCNTTPPVAPAVLLNWTASSGAISYYVYRDGTQYAGPFSSGQLTFDNNVNVAAGQTYSYFIRATNSSGSRDSNTLVVQVASSTCETQSLHHFTFSSISSPKSENVPFTITLTARDAAGNVVPYSGRVNLRASLGGVDPTYVTTVDGVVSTSVKVLGKGLGIRLTAEAQGSTGQSNAFDVTGTGSATGSLNGKVTTADGEVAIVNALVFLRSSSSTQAETTDQLGGFKFTGKPCGSYEVFAGTQDGRSSEVKSVTIECGKTHTANLEVPGSACNQDGVTPILLVPGILGSSLPSLLLPKLPEDSPRWNDARWGSWSRNLGGLYDPFVPFSSYVGWKNLATAVEERNSGYRVGCTIFPVPYDWRRPIDEIVRDYLIPRIDEAMRVAGTSKVDIVAHSMGGLVARAYVQGDDYDGRSDIAQLAMVGTPNKGAALAYYIWQGSNPDNSALNGFFDELMFRVALDADNFYHATANELFAVHFHRDPLCPERSNLLNPLFPGDCRLAYRTDMFNLFHSFVPSVRQLLPAGDDALIPGGRISCEPATEWQNAWLRGLNNDQEGLGRMGSRNATDRIQTLILAGGQLLDYNTVGTIQVGEKRCTELFYPDGVPTDRPIMLGGDGTVTLANAYLSPPITFLANKPDASHASLVRKYVQELTDFLLEGEAGTQPLRADVLAALTAESTTGEQGLSVKVLGQPQPLLIAPSGARSGIDPATGGTVREIPGTEVDMSLGYGSLKLADPADGEYLVQLSGNEAGDFILELEYSGAGDEERARLRGFHDGPMTIQFRIASSESPALVVEHAPEPPAGLRADPSSGASPSTLLSWEPAADSAVTGYYVYGKLDSSPRLSRIATVTSNSFDTPDPWSGTAALPKRVYAVSATYADGSESFLSNMVTNDDRDHDGVSDEEEALHGTSPVSSDTDGDGWSDGEELLHRTSPLVRDTDGDGYDDLAEMRAGGDPLNPASLPGLGFYMVTPCRVLDTRNPVGPFGGPALVHGNARIFRLAGRCGIPAAARAVAANLTVVQPSGSGHLTVYPGDMGMMPTTSTVSFSVGQVRANNAVLPLSFDSMGSLAVYPFVSGAGQLHMVLDITGYFAPAVAALPEEVVHTLTQGAAGMPGKDIWTTSVFSYDGVAQTPGGGLDNEELRVGGWGDEYYSLLQFDLTNLPQQASSVRLELYCLSSGSGTPTGLLLDRVTEDWDWRIQGTGRDRQRLWWVDRPDWLQWRSQELPSPTPGAWYTIDVTDLYKAWKNGTFPNYGLQLRPTSTANRWGMFASSQHSNPALRPRLVVVP